MIKAQENFKVTHEGIEYVNIIFNDGEYDRSVPVNDWNSDPERVIAEVSDHLSQKKPEIKKIENPETKIMTDAQVEEKLSEIEEETPK